MKIFSLVFVCLFLSFAAFAQTNGSVKDVPIHCSIVLSSVKAVTVKMNIAYVKSTSPKIENKVVVVSYTTNGTQNMVNFTGSPAKTWAIGKYRVDIFIDGKLSKSKEFEVTKTEEASKSRP